MTHLLEITTLGGLKAAGYTSKSIKEELRDNLIGKLKSGEPAFEGILGYEHTVIPQVERAILSGHSINLLGLRGQAKTRIARLMTNLLDEYIPVVEGSEINDDPLAPLSAVAQKIIEEQGDDTPISWLHRSQRYSEKLATPDVNIADLIGDIDPIKAANLRLSFSDEGVIHFGMIPRANRGIFVINELPDLQPRIQVALFNILQEGDVQIRGFNLRFPLDVQFIFTANPEDYTNRGAIITPLKDRIQSQIFTHYPKSIDIGQAITQQEVKLTSAQGNILIPDIISRMIEQIAVEARVSEYIDEKSGVSARLPISAYEAVVSAVERRMILNGETSGTARIGDLSAAIPAIIGKIEMVYEGEQEGAVSVAHRLIGAALRSLAPDYFKNIDLIQNKSFPEIKEEARKVAEWFEQGNTLDLVNDAPEADFQQQLDKIDELEKVVRRLSASYSDKGKYLLMEYFIHVMAEYSMLDKKLLEVSYNFRDYFSSVMPG